MSTPDTPPDWAVIAAIVICNSAMPTGSGVWENIVAAIIARHAPSSESAGLATGKQTPDTARLDWLEAIGLFECSASGFTVMTADYPNGPRFFGATLRQAIDAALAASKETK